MRLRRLIPARKQLARFRLLWRVHPDKRMVETCWSIDYKEAFYYIFPGTGRILYMLFSSLAVRFPEVAWHSLV